MDFRSDNSRDARYVDAFPYSRLRIVDAEVQGSAAIIRDEMESAYELAVPLVVDTGIGRNWLEAQH